MTTRDETKNVLANWLATDGTAPAGAEAAWLWALAIKEQEGGGSYEDNLVRDIVDVLAGIPYDMITREDAEVMLYTLSNPPQEADLGQNLLWNHLDAMDADSRRDQLANDPFYGQFCNPTR